MHRPARGGRSSYQRFCGPIGSRLSRSYTLLSSGNGVDNARLLPDKSGYWPLYLITTQTDNTMWVDDQTGKRYNPTAAPVRALYVPKAATDKRYTAIIPPLGCQTSLRVPGRVASPPTIQWHEQVNQGKPTPVGGLLTPAGDAFDVKGYGGYNAAYQLTMSVTGCEGTLVWTTDQDPTVSVTASQLSFSDSHTPGVATTTAYLPFPPVTTTYYASYYVTNPDGTREVYAAGPAKTLLIRSEQCLRIEGAGAVVAKGNSVQLKAVGCTGTVSWQTEGQLVGIGSDITHTPLPPATPAIPAPVRYTATCSEPVCTQTVSVSLGECQFSLTASRQLVSIAESVTLSASGCAGGEVVWGTGQEAPRISVKPLEKTRFTADCIVGGSVVCSGSVTLEVINTPPPPITCPDFRLTCPNTSLARCSGQTALITPEGCPPGSTITWSDGRQSGPTDTYKAAFTQTSVVSATCTTPYQLAATQQLTLTVANQLNISPTSVYGGYKAILRATGCYTPDCQPGQYSWNTGQRGSSIEVTLDKPTTYRVSCSEGGTASQLISLKASPCPIDYQSPAVIRGKATLRLPAGCDLAYGVRWYKDDYSVASSRLVAINQQTLTVDAPGCDAYGTGADYYHVVCVKGEPVPCETRFTVSCNPGIHGGGQVASSDPSTPDPCTEYGFVAKAGLVNLARNPGDDEVVGSYYQLYTDWCKGQLVWSEPGGGVVSRLTVGPFTGTLPTYQYVCKLSSGQVCRGDYALPAPEPSGGRLAAPEPGVSTAGGSNCSSQLSLATASGVFYGQLLCQLSNLIHTREDALAQLTALQQQLSGTGLVFPADLTAVVDALAGGDCRQAAQLLAAANGNTVIDDETFNTTIKSQFAKIQERITDTFEASYQVLGEPIQNDDIKIIVSVTASNQNEIDDSQPVIAQVDRRQEGVEDRRSDINKLPVSSNAQHYFRELCTVWNMTGQPAYVDYLSNTMAIPAAIQDGISQLQNKPLVFPDLVRDRSLANLSESFLKDFFRKKIQGYESKALGVSSLYTGPNKTLYETVAAQLLNHFYEKSGTEYFQMKDIADAIYSTDVGNRRINNMIKIVDALLFRKIGNLTKPEDSDPGNYQKDLVPTAVWPKRELDDQWFKVKCKSNVFPSFGPSDALTLNALPGAGDAERLGLFTIGGTQGIDVRVKSLFPILTPSERGYEATIIIRYLDTFGVSEEDYSKALDVPKLPEGNNLLSQWNYLRFNYRGGVLSQWILQHQYGYPPFTDYLTYTVKMKRTWNAN